MIHERYLQVLRYLAFNQPASKYQMEKRLRPEIDHATLHEVVSDLKKTYLIRVVRTEKFRIKSLKVEYYDLRLMGLMAVIQQEYDHVHSKQPIGLDVDRIAERQQSLLPLILGKWRLFIESGWQPQVRLVESCSISMPNVLNIVDVNIRPTKSMGPIGTLYLETKDESPPGDEKGIAYLESDLRDSTYERFFFLGSPRSGFPAPLWMKVAKDTVYDLDRIWVKDPEIFNWIMDRLEKHMEEYKEYHVLLEERKKNLETLQRRERGIA